MGGAGYTKILGYVQHSVEAKQPCCMGDGIAPVDSIMCVRLVEEHNVALCLLERSDSIITSSDLLILKDAIL